MRVRETTLDGFLSEVEDQGSKIVIYGAGVIGKITLPAFIDDRGLGDSILFAVDGDPRKWGGSLQVGDREIRIFSPERLKEMGVGSVILVTASRYETILRYLDKIGELSETNVYLFPLMLTKECAFFEKQDIEKRSETPLIPKVIHYCWFGRKEMPDKLKKCRESWSRFCPDYQIVEWNEDSYDIEKHTYTRQAYHHKKWGFIPDVARLEILYENGGIYLDTDVELIRNLDGLLYQPGFVGVEKWGVINMINSY